MQPTTPTPSAPRNAMESLSDEAFNELMELDQYCKNMFEYSARIDDSLRTVSLELEKIGGKMLEGLEENKKVYFSNKKEADDAIATATMLAGGTALAFRGVVGLYSELKRQHQLGKLLSLKQDIATEKLPVVEQLIPRAAKNVERYEKLVGAYTGRTYDVARIKDLPRFRAELQSVMGRYRLAYFLFLSFSYMRDEYQAWLSGRHDSDTPSPIYLDVNNQIMKCVLYPECAADFDRRPELMNEEGEHYAEQGQLHEDLTTAMNSGKASGRTLFVMVDDGLMAYYLSSCHNAVYVNDWLAQTWLSGLSDLARENEAIVKAEPYYTALSKVLSKGSGATKWVVLYLLLGIAIGYGAWQLEAEWMKWTALVVGEVFVLWRMVVKGSKCVSLFEAKQNYIVGEARNAMLLKAGDTPRREKLDTETSSIWVYTLCGAIVGFMFIPFPGGLIIGALIASGLHKWSGDSDDNEFEKLLE